MRNQSVVDLALSNKEAVVFTTSRNRWAIRSLISVGLTLAFIAIYHFFGEYSFLASGCAGIFAMIAMMNLFSITKPPQLQIDASGLTTSTSPLLRQHRILWSQVEEIRIIRRTSLIGREELWLVAWLHPGVPSLKWGLYPPEWRPVWSTDIGAMKVCGLSDFSTPAVEIGNAVSRFAGKRWNESRELR